MGGGTGTGGAPVIAGRNFWRRAVQAQEGISEIFKLQKVN
jgi:hypothetical protein